MTSDPEQRREEHLAATRAAYDRLAPVWSETTDDGPFNAHLERPALRALVPQPLRGRTVLDAGCGSGAQCEWLASLGAHVVGVDLSPAMVEEARRRCGDAVSFAVADLHEPLDLESSAFDGITCSLTLHYLRGWVGPLVNLARVLRPGGWLVMSVDHPFAPPLETQRRGYFDTELVADTWRKADVEVTQRFWRRPLAASIDAFADAGFYVDRLVEARPDAAGIARFPDELGPLGDTPSFIVYRLRRRED